MILVQDTTETNLTRPEQQVVGAGPLDGGTRRGALLHPLMPGAFRFDLWFTLAARARLIEFFLKAILGDHPFDAPGADFQTRLAKLLANHVGGSVRIEEAAPNHLSRQFAGSPVVGLGSPWFAL